MKFSSMSRCLLVIVALVSLEAVASAATLQAKVTEVESGNVVVVANINRYLRVRLKGVAPPEPGQPFSDAAREHLNALVLNKAVAVEYTHLASGYLEARVMLNGIDVGSQMIRDGVAWYDRTVEYSLSPGDRDLYARCEQAARDEKRGLWSDAKAIAPWEFRKSQAAAATATATATAKANADVPRSFSAIWAHRKSGASKVLSNRFLGAGQVEPGAIAGNPTMKQIAPDSAPDEWTVFQSAAPRFSIRVPSNSYLYEYPVLDSSLKIVNLNYLVGLNDGTVYMLMWTRGANENLTDALAADLTMQGLMSGLNEYFEKKGDKFNAASFTDGRNMSRGGYAGKNYSVSAGVLSGSAWIVSREVGDERQLFAVVVFASPGADTGYDFVNSLKILDAQQ